MTSYDTPKSDGIHVMAPRERMGVGARKQRDTYAIKPGAPFLKREFGFYCLEDWYEQGLSRDQFAASGCSRSNNRTSSCSLGIVIFHDSVCVVYCEEKPSAAYLECNAAATSSSEVWTKAWVVDEK